MPAARKALTAQRVRVPVLLRARLEQEAKRAGLTYRAYLQQLTEQGIAGGYRPKPADVVYETRVPMDRRVKDALRKVAREAGLKPEEYLLHLFDDAIDGAD